MQENPQGFSELPEETKVIRKVKQQVNLDGDIVEIEIYEEIGICVDDDGQVIPEQEIEKMLEGKNITEIEKNAAVQMWVEERKAEYNEAQKEFESFQRAWNSASDGGDRI